MFQIMSKVICLLNTPLFLSIGKATQMSKCTLIILVVLRDCQSTKEKRVFPDFSKDFKWQKLGF